MFYITLLFNLISVTVSAFLTSMALGNISHFQDYTGANVTVNNFLAAFLGNKSALTGGSGKVIESGPEDHIFVFYSDHGGPGVLGIKTNFLLKLSLLVYSSIA